MARFARVAELCSICVKGVMSLQRVLVSAGFAHVCRLVRISFGVATAIPSWRGRPGHTLCPAHMTVGQCSHHCASHKETGVRHFELKSGKAHEGKTELRLHIVQDWIKFDLGQLPRIDGPTDDDVVGEGDQGSESFSSSSPVDLSDAGPSSHRPLRRSAS